MQYENVVSYYYMLLLCRLDILTSFFSVHLSKSWNGRIKHNVTLYLDNLLCPVTSRSLSSQPICVKVKIKLFQVNDVDGDCLYLCLGL